MTEFGRPPTQNDILDARLADLRQIGGEDLVRRLLGRFETHLAELRDAPDDAWTRSLAHRTAGLAGMIGFDRLTAACHAIEDAPRADRDLLEEARAAAADALGAVRLRLRPDA